MEAVRLTAGPESHRSASDAELLEAFHKGEPAAFAALYGRYVRAVRSVCFARLADQEAADAVQETFTRLLAGLRGLAGPVDMQRYVKRVARNVCIDYYRRRQPAEELTEQVLDLVTDPQDVGATVERQMTAMAVLSELRPFDRTLLIEHHANGMSLRDVARAHSSTPGSIKVLLFRARAKARAAAEANGLHALWPFPLLHGLRRLLRRLGGVNWPVAVAAVAPLVAAIVVTAPPPGDGRPANLPVPQAPAGSVRAGATSPADGDGLQGRPTRPGSHVAGGAHGPEAVRPTTTPQREQVSARRPLAAVQPFAVPATNRQLRTAPPPGQTFDYDYGVHVRAGGAQARVGVAVNDEHSSRPVHEAACGAAESAPVALQCVRDQPDE